ncbi:MAG: phosphoribosylformylglycinamidine cyclo-ligase [Actinomycetota bacterium]|nr:phosphoribosylformylglycinamidine cyclo-ligase [Actinomycetota bacterium]
MCDKNKIGKSKGYSYRSAGVDIDRASNVLGQLKKTIASTFSKNVLGDLSSFSGLFQLDPGGYKNPVLASSTDGVGTKIMLAKKLNNYRGIGQDAVAMCINDVICCGAKPLFFLDYISCGKINEEKIKTIIESISRSCVYCNTVLIGGETAEHPGMSARDEIDIAGFAVGIIEKEDILTPSMVKEGDVIAGIASSGIHSNGFSLVRKIIDDKKIDPGKKYRWTENKTLGDILLTPTKLYSRTINKMTESGVEIHGIAHITGGGFYENINRIIPGELDASVNEGSWKIPEIFNFIKEQGDISKREMFRVFNMGIGLAAIMPPGQFEGAKNIAGELKEDIYNIGNIIKGKGKVIIKRD